MGIYIGQQRLAYLWGKIKSIIPTKVSDLTNDSGFTSNVGTITGITMNGTSKGTSGVVDLGTVITDISGKQDALVSGTNIKTINNESILGSGNITISGGSGDVSGKEDKSNKVTSLSSSSTDTQYPSAKCVYDLIGDVESLLAAI